MSNSSILVATQPLSALLRFLDAQENMHIDLRNQLIAEQTASRISIERWWELLDTFAEALQVDALGVRIGRYFQLEDLGALGYLVASCDAVMTALQKLQRYEALIHNFSYLKLSMHDVGLRLQWAGCSVSSTAISNEFVVSSLITTIQRLVGSKKLVPVVAELTGPLSGSESLYQQLLGCPVVTNAAHPAITLPVECLSWSINGCNSQLRSILEQQTESMLANSLKPDSFLDKVHEKMLAGMECGELNAPWLALQLGLSECVFYRMLAERGRRFQNILDELRYKMARRYLNDPQFELSEIVLMLGFSEQSAFCRAFKQWSGQTPMSYRRSHPRP